jgi:cytochrome P450
MPALYDPFSPTFHADPYPNYHWLRTYHPVFRNELAAGGEWLLTRHADVAQALRDPRLSSEMIPPCAVDQLAASGQPRLASLARLFVDMPILADGARHARLRGLVVKAFTPRAVERLRERLLAVADALLDAAAPLGELEVIEGYATPLAVAGIAALLGLPSAREAPLKSWADDIVLLLDRSTKGAGLERAAASASELTRWVRGWISERRAEPGEDLVSGLIAARQRDDALTEDELVSICVLLLAAGHQTTLHAIGNATHALICHPGAQEALRSEPASRVSAVEELLRYDGPLQRVWRTARTDIEWDGRRIGAGDDVVLLLGAANRDPAVFPEPDRLDLGRRDLRHLAFGHGAHFCLGAALARLELQLALGRLLERLPPLELASGALEWRSGSMVRGLRALPVRF